MISVLILTRNEQQDLPACLASVAWSDDIHVLDSFSTDHTVALATAAGARVTQRIFDHWSSHQNWALAHLPFRHPWVLYLDADERCSPELRDAMQAAVETPGAVVAFNVERRDFLSGTWLRHVQTSAFYLRLFRPQAMRYERLVNPISLPSGPTGTVPGYLDHFPFSKGYGAWFDRHNQYSRLEAEHVIAAQRSETAPTLSGALFEKDFHRRRAQQKALFYTLPARPLIKFFALYVVKRGFLDGRAGFTYSVLQAIYEYMIVLKSAELRRTQPRDR